MSENQTVTNQKSSTKVSQNGKGERAFEAKVYEGTSQEELDSMVEKTVSTLEKLIQRAG